ncbi:hypothetical protein HY990_04885 [Candidatus Micrarchaeota archaeon]|nr:hypothetical protein [Candidatus Micrarchaeota archaeon]
MEDIEDLITGFFKQIISVLPKIIIEFLLSVGVLIILLAILIQVPRTIEDEIGLTILFIVASIAGLWKIEDTLRTKRVERIQKIMAYLAFYLEVLFLMSVLFLSAFLTIRFNDQRIFWVGFVLSMAAYVAIFNRITSDLNFVKNQVFVKEIKEKNMLE